MNNKSITPSVQQPVNRVASGQLPSALAELSEAALAGADVMPSAGALCSLWSCAFDGDE
jgi:bacteriocin leader peptide (microcyclamide/patellamide family)